jgi:hypothetical protein
VLKNIDEIAFHNAQQTADGASAMTSQVENTRKYLDELAAVVGLRSA